MPPVEALTGDREVLDGALRLRAKLGARRNADLAHRVVLHSRLAYLAARRLKVPIVILDELTETVIKSTGSLDLASGLIRGQYVQCPP